MLLILQVGNDWALVPQVKSNQAREFFTFNCLDLDKLYCRLVYTEYVQKWVHKLLGFFLDDSA